MVWFGDGNRRLLFKAEDRETGEDWAEVVACHLCGLLELLHVKYELAAEYDGGQYIRPGVVCENMTHKSFVLVLGNELLPNELLPAADPQYPQAERFKVRQHTVEAVCDIVAQPGPPSEDSMTYVPPLLPGIESDLDVFVGYVLVAAWMANQGRHHENRGAFRDGSTLRLAPTFDHGAALARNLLDEEREE